MNGVQAADVDAIASALESAAILVIRQLGDRSSMSGTGAEVLHRLETDGPTRLTALAQGVGVSQPAMTQLVQRFERQGLVVRRVDPADRRAALVILTEAGADVLEQRRRDIRARLAARLDALDDEDRSALELAFRVASPIVAKLREVDPVVDPLHPPAI